MQKTEEIANSAACLEGRISELEELIAPLREDVKGAESQLQTHVEALTEAEGYLEKAQNAYRSECRKLARDEEHDAVGCKHTVQEAETRVEGLKLLIADDEAAVEAARKRLERPERELQSARHRTHVESCRLGIAQAIDRVAEKRCLLEQEVQAAINEIDVHRSNSEIREHALDMQRLRLQRLKDFLGQPMFHAS